MADQPRDDGGPAYPLPLACSPAGDVEYPDQRGMSLRDFFAGQALTAVLARTDLRAPWLSDAKQAYEIADAMLQARKA